MLRVAALFQAQTKTAAKVSELKPSVEEALEIHKDLAAWVNKFETVIQRAPRTGLEPGWVWQDSVLGFLHQLEGFLTQLKDLDETLESIYLSEDSKFGDIANAARGGTIEAPRKARLEYAISNFEFYPDPKTGQDQIAYKEATLADWANEFERWVANAIRVLSDQKRRLK